MKNTKAFLILVIAITVITCTPKQSGTTTQPRTSSESGTTAAEKMPPVQIRLVTSHDTLETVNIIGEYFDTNRDEGESTVIWTNITVRDFNYILIDFDYEKDGLFAESILHSINEFPHGKMFLLRFPWIGDGMPSRGIMFLDQNNIRRFFYIGESGVDGSFSLNEFQNAHPVESLPETDIYEPFFDGETPAEFQIDGTILVRYNGNGENVIIPSTVTEIGDAAFIRA